MLRDWGLGLKQVAYWWGYNEITINSADEQMTAVNWRNEGTYQFEERVCALGDDGVTGSIVDDTLGRLKVEGLSINTHSSHTHTHTHTHHIHHTHTTHAHHTHIPPYTHHTCTHHTHTHTHTTHTMATHHHMSSHKHSPSTDSSLAHMHSLCT